MAKLNDLNKRLNLVAKLNGICGLNLGKPISHLS
jgi:hypothetical protein